MIKIAFFDFDNTLFSHYTDQIPVSNIKALDELRNNNVLVYMCTGRPKSELKLFDLSGLNIDGLIASEGQIAYDKDSNVLFDNPIDGVLKDKIIELFNEKRIPIMLNVENEIYANCVDDVIMNIRKKSNTPYPNIKEYSGEKFYMASAFRKNDEIWKEVYSLSNIATIEAWDENAIDFLPIGASKALGIEKLLNMLNIDKSKSICFGDSSNDLEMMKYCGISVAMGNASQDIKDISTYITDDIDSDGIYNALKHFKLI